MANCYQPRAISRAIKAVLMLRGVGLAVALLGLLQPGSAFAHRTSVNLPPAHILRVEVTSRITPAFGGKSYGSAGQYELLRIQVTASLDPRAAANRSIIGLHRAKTRSDGQVEYSFDLAILKPIDMNRANGKLVYEVTNRGLGGIDLAGKSDARTAFYQDMGYVYINAGWQGELPPDGAGLVAALPEILNKRAPIKAVIDQELAPGNVVGPGTDLANAVINLNYPAASLDPKRAKLYVREREADPWHLLPPSQIAFLDEHHVKLRPADGYDAGAIYTLRYTATHPLVSGIGLSLVRDLISFLRFDRSAANGDMNPLLGSDGSLRISRAYAIGYSQSGRYLRVFVWEGFNADVNGKQVFDAVMPIIAGARKGDFNRVFAQPGTSSTQHEWHRAPDNGFPFAYAVTHDPISGKNDGILRLCAVTKTCPKIVHLDSGNEMAAAFSWMLTTSTTGKPIQQPANIRIYYAAGTQHSPGTAALGCRGAPVSISWKPFQRALFVAMDRWADAGVSPPASRYPTVADGSLVSLASARAQWPSIPGFPFSMIRNRPFYWDYAPIVPRLRASYPVLTTRLNTDGNEVDGIVHPQIAVPIGTVSGNSLRLGGNAEGEQCFLQGEFIPFRSSLSDRITASDPRPSLAERYPNGQVDYIQRVRAAVDDLVRNWLVLKEDAVEIMAARLP